MLPPHGLPSVLICCVGMAILLSRIKARPVGTKLWCCCMSDCLGDHHC